MPSVGNTVGIGDVLATAWRYKARIGSVIALTRLERSNAVTGLVRPGVTAAALRVMVSHLYLCRLGQQVESRSWGHAGFWLLFV